MPQRFWPWLLIATALVAGCGERDRTASRAPAAPLPPDAPAVADETVPAARDGVPAPPDTDATLDDEPVPADEPSLAMDARVGRLLQQGSHAALRRALRILLEQREHVGPPTAENVDGAPMSEAVVKGLIEWDSLALWHGELAWAQRDLPLLQRWSPQDARVQKLAAQLQQSEQVQQLLTQAARARAKGHLLAPESNNAVAKLQAVLAIQATNSEALRGLAKIEQSLIASALSQAEKSQFKDAQVLLAQASRVRNRSVAVQNAATRVMEIRERAVRAQMARIDAELATGDLDAATQLVPGLEAIALNERATLAARAAIDRVRRYGAYDAGALFSDPLASGGQGPGMVVIPVGQFEMGSPRGEANRRSNEGRQHEVQFRRGFALSRTEVTVAQFRRFIEASDYRTTAQRDKHSQVYDESGGALVEKRRVYWKHGYTGRTAADDMPVLHVSWEDAQAYARWLAAETGMAYRLPSEAEFEYVVRAGSSSPYPWGEAAPDTRLENLTGALDRSPSKRQWSNAFPNYGDGFWGPAPVASFVSNPFGVSDINGNVSEWVADCWHDSYSRAPKDGSAWVNPGCKDRVVRGASWASSPAQARSAFRAGMDANTTSARIGFRVARDL
ncbi:MAG: SUMF1/EgtB/PvdO family nonheme iron enzyme [Xanthomonadales bacterium]|nr:SUMF1/EgtB/PvdO family nonheme iron enzyme [Xanthomonadales bacterium]